MRRPVLRHVGPGINARHLGEIVELTTYNQSFPQMTEEMFLTQEFGGTGQRRVYLPDLPRSSRTRSRIAVLRCRVPLFGRREVSTLAAALSPGQEAALAEKVRELFPEAQLLNDDFETAVVVHPRAEVTLTTSDGITQMAIICGDGGLAGRIRAEVEKLISS
jgi:hypothetical protein